ncbi:hypothetical protein CYMTET_36895 [Cymbomonas tetramitiformis]|uniref:Uncharacterized protein n=1 Tax=Cymbomonas tetramitiformis TaxID=36881 RepID=A0AAE0CH85_9CHLO|nr:hypothetical protein CYMTET_36895 [Cymbomonas tetramitiformis]
MQQPRPAHLELGARPQDGPSRPAGGLKGRAAYSKRLLGSGDAGLLLLEESELNPQVWRSWLLTSRTVGIQARRAQWASKRGAHTAGAAYGRTRWLALGNIGLTRRELQKTGLTSCSTWASPADEAEPRGQVTERGGDAERRSVARRVYAGGADTAPPLKQVATLPVKGYKGLGHCPTLKLLQRCRQGSDTIALAPPQAIYNAAGKGSTLPRPLKLFATLQQLGHCPPPLKLFATLQATARTLPRPAQALCNAAGKQPDTALPQARCNAAGKGSDTAPPRLTSSCNASKGSDTPSLKHVVTLQAKPRTLPRPPLKLFATLQVRARTVPLPLTGKGSLP